MASKNYPQSTKFRIICGAACFYASAKGIREGLGDFTNFNLAVMNALTSLEYIRRTAKPHENAKADSISGIFNEIHIELLQVD